MIQAKTLWTSWAAATTAVAATGAKAERNAISSLSTQACHGKQPSG